MANNPFGVIQKPTTTTTVTKPVGTGNNPFGGGSTTAPTPSPSSPNPSAPTTQPQSSQSSTLPFMAVGMTAPSQPGRSGEPYYSKVNGFVGWARRTYANIFAPEKFVPTPTPEQQTAETNATAKITGTLNNTLRWDDWAGKLFGISASEVAQSGAAILTALTSDKGENKGKPLPKDITVGSMATAMENAVQVGVGMGTRILGQSVMQGLSLFGIIDQLNRKGQIANNLTLDSIADRASSLPDVPQWTGLFTGLKAVYDDFRIAQGIASGKLSVPELFKELQVTGEENRQASNAAYTMIFNEQRRAEFYRRYQSGEDPQKIQMELANPWIELAGSIIGDPVTYMGMSLPARGGKIFGIGLKEAELTKIVEEAKPLFTLGAGWRFADSKEVIKIGLNHGWEFKQVLPNLGEIFNFSKSLGVGRLLNEADDIAKMPTEIKDVYKPIEAAADSDIATAVNNVLKKAANYLKNLQRDFGITSGTTTARRAWTSHLQGQFLQAAFEPGTAVGMDTLVAWDDLAKAFETGDEAGYALAYHTLEQMPHAETVLSKGALQTALTVHWMKERGQLGAFVDAMDAYKTVKAYESVGQVVEDVEMLDKAKWVEGIIKRPNGIGGFLMDEMDTVMKEIIPDVNQMKKASQLAQKAVEEGKLEKNLDLIPDTESGIREIDRLWAKRYDELPSHVKLANEFNESLIGRGWHKAVGYFSNIYITWGLNSYPVRNAVSQGIAIGYDYGFDFAARQTAESLINMASDKSYETYHAMQVGQVKKILGFAPEGMFRGTSGSAEASLSTKGISVPIGHGDVVDLINGAKQANKVDNTQRSGCILQTLRTDLPKTLRATMYPVDELKAADLTDEEIGLAISSVLDNYGHIKPASKNFYKVTGAGQALTRATTRPNEQLMGFLNFSPDLADDFIKAQLESKTPEEFIEAKDKILAAFRASKVAGSGALTNGIAHDLPQGMQEVAAAVTQAVGKSESPQSATLYVELLNVNKKLRTDAKDVMGLVNSKLDYSAGAVNNEKALNDFWAEWKKLDTGEIVADNAHSLTNWVKQTETAFFRRKITVEQLLNAEVKLPSGEVWRFADYLELAPEKIDKSNAIDQLWRASFKYNGDKWNESAAAMIEHGTPLQKKYAEALGINFEEFVGRLYPDQLNPYEGLNNLNIERQQISDAWIASRSIRPNYPPDAMMADLDGLGKGQYNETYGFKSWTKTQPNVRSQAVFDAVNARRAKMGVDPAIRIADIDAKEARIAIESKTDSEWQKAFDAVIAKRAGIEPEVVEEVASTAEEVNQSKAVTYLSAHPPTYMGGKPQVAQTAANNEAGFTAAINQYVDDIVSKWDESVPVRTKFNSNQIKALEGWFENEGNRASVVRTKISLFATAKADFALHDYMKTYGDIAAGFLMPYQYWYTQTYQKFIERALSDPTIMTFYNKYRNFIANEHAGLPDWWKYNIPITFLPGTSVDNPMYFNLEATVNPLNSLFGVDFNDPYKRVDWLSSSLDDISKFGPTPFVPLTWLVALNLYHKGENDAANRWVGRLIPQTTAIKAAMNVAIAGKTLTDVTGLSKFQPGSPLAGLRYGEFDPFVLAFEGGLDPYEQRRVRRALAWDVQKGKLTAEQAVDQAYQQSGPQWDAAVRESIQAGAGGQIFSAFAGVGFKPRSKEDLQIDQFYSDYSQLISMRSTMSATEYQTAWNKMRDSYQFMDVVLIGGKATADRDSAFSYNVLSRIPPGQMTQFLEVAGINSDMIDKFYTDKGTFSGWTPQDKDRFMAGMVDIGALLKMPQGATRQEWTDAKNMYQQMTDLTTQQFGATITDTIDAYYNETAGINRRKFLDAHPEVQAAMTFQTDFITKNQLLYKYYGGLETLDRYWRNQMYADLDKRFPKIQTLRDQYNALKIADEAAVAQYNKAHPELAARNAAHDQLMAALVAQYPGIQTVQDEYDRIKAEEPDKAKSFYAQHPELKAYIKGQTTITALLKKQFPTYTALSYGLSAVKQAQDFYDAHPELSRYNSEKAVWEDKVNRAYVRMSDSLPNLPPYQVRSDFVPQGQVQTQLQAQTQPTPQPTIDDLTAILSASRADYLLPLINAYWNKGTPLSYAAQQELQYVSQYNGFYDENDFLKAWGMALQNK